MIRRALLLSISVMLVLFLVSASVVWAQGVGMIQRPTCAAITSPVAKKTWCRDESTGVIFSFDGTGYQSDAALATGVLNVKDPRWGAKGDGVTDDTAAIQSALNALPAGVLGGGIVFIPAGTYKTTSTLTVPNTTGNVTIQGAGMRATTLDWQGGNGTGSTAVIFFNSTTAAYTIGKRIADLRISNSLSATGMVGIRYGYTTGTATNQDFITIERSMVQDVTLGVTVDGNDSSAIDQLIVAETLFFNSAAIMVTGVTLTPGTTPSGIITRSLFYNNAFTGLTSWAVDIPNGSTIVFLNNYISSAALGAAGIRLDKYNGFTFLSNEFSFTAGGASVSPGISIGPTALGPQNLSGGLIAGNNCNFVVPNAAQSCIYLNFADGVTIEGNNATNVGNGITLTANTGRVTIGQQNWGIGVTTKLNGGTLPTIPPIVLDSAIGISFPTALLVPSGGTGLSTFAIGDLIYANATSTLARLADVAAGSYLRSGGIGVAPLWSTLTLPNAATINRIPYAISANTWGDAASLTYDGSMLGLVGTGLATVLQGSNNSTTGVNALRTVNDLSDQTGLRGYGSAVVGSVLGVPAARLSEVRGDGTGGLLLDTGGGGGSIYLNAGAGTGSLWRLDPTGLLISPGVAFTALGAPSNGALVFCVDCTIANPCASGGTGALAKRLGGAWVCN